MSKRSRFDDNEDENRKVDLKEVTLSELLNSICNDDDFVRFEETREEIMMMGRPIMMKDCAPDELFCDLQKYLMVGGDVNAKIDDLTPIIVQIFDDQEEETDDLVRTLGTLIQFGVNVNATNQRGDSALGLAITRHFFKCVEKLYNAGATSDELLHWRKGYQVSALKLVQKRIKAIMLDIDDNPHSTELQKELQKELSMYELVEKMEQKMDKKRKRFEWTGKTVRAVQQWRPDGVERTRGEYNQMRDVFRKFAQSGYMGGGSRSQPRSPRRRSRSRSRSRSSRRRSLSRGRSRGRFRSR